MYKNKEVLETLKEYEGLKSKLDDAIKDLIDTNTDMAEYDEESNTNKTFWKYEDTDLENLKARRQRIINHLIIFKKRHPEYSYQQEITETDNKTYLLTITIIKYGNPKEDSGINTENS